MEDSRKPESYVWCLTIDRYGQRRALLDLGPRARRAAEAKTVICFRAHPDDNDDDDDADNNNNNNNNSGSSLGHEDRYSRNSPQRPPQPKESPTFPFGGGPPSS